MLYFDYYYFVLVSAGFPVIIVILVIFDFFSLLITIIIFLFGLTDRDRFHPSAFHLHTTPHTTHHTPHTTHHTQLAGSPLCLSLESHLFLSLVSPFISPRPLLLTSHLHLVWFDLSPTNPPASVSREIGVTGLLSIPTRAAKKLQEEPEESLLKIHHRTITDTPLWPPEPCRFSRPPSGHNYCGLAAGHNRQQSFSRKSPVGEAKNIVRPLREQPIIINPRVLI